MNYVSYSLWGDKPLYNVGAIKNSEQIKNIYPNWKMVLYYDESVPKTTIQKLLDNNVLCVDMSNKNIYGMFWRFLASDISDADYVCFRDCDSRLSEREYLAVQEWLQSNKTLHVMRDHPAHRIPYGNNELGILGGMWGIKSKKLPITEMIIKYNQENCDLGYGSDQTFLKKIYNTFINDRHTHDDFFENKPFPIERKNGRFIGERIDINENPLTDDYKILL
jgi:hypothetical protein